MKQHITILGTGRMGSALALAFLGHGHAVTVWNRTEAKARRLEAKGARVARSVEAAVSGADLVVANVSDYATCTALLSPPAVTRALRGKLLAQLTTGTPREARGAAAWARENAIAYLDGAIMASPNFIGQAGCTLLYSGARELFTANQATLSALGGNSQHVGEDAGSASALDAAVLTVFWAAHFGVWHATAICEAEGVSLQVFAKMLSATMPVFDDALKDAIQRVAQRRFTADEDTMASVETCHFSARLIHQISQEHRIHLGLTEALEVIFARTAAAGRSQHDLAAVYQTFTGG